LVTLPKNSGLGTEFSYYSTLRRWLYAKCRPGLKRISYEWIYIWPWGWLQM